MQTAFLFLIAVSSSALLPPPPMGARYHKTLDFPLVGHQTVTLHIATPSVASIDMDGVINHHETLGYTIHPETNQVRFQLSDGLNRRLTRYRCRIQEVWYDAEHDEACITLRIDTLHIHKRVRMERAPTGSQGIKGRPRNVGARIRPSLGGRMERNPSPGPDAFMRHRQSTFFDF